MCNSVNLKLGGIIESLLKILNVLHMGPRFGVAHSDQLARHAYGGVCLEVPAALLLHVTKCSIFNTVQ